MGHGQKCRFFFIQEWTAHWVFSRQIGESGFHWLVPLWTYRDTDVRAAGMGITAALARSTSGREALTEHCGHLAGGIWATAFTVLLDRSECSLVRQQVRHVT